MIDSIILNNFQSHKKSHLDFDKGINVIIGSSNDGKTAILRALNWSLNNRPSGLSLLSYWERDINGGSIDHGMSCGIYLDGIGIWRIRNSSFNGYTIPSAVFEAIKTDVPEEISKLFNMSEVNLQKQFDTPFLLSESAAEVARSFNKIINLDIIDKVLSGAERQRWVNNRSIDKDEEDLEQIETELKTFDWIESAKSKFGRASIINEKLSNNEVRYEEVGFLLDKIAEKLDDLDALPNEVILKKSTDLITSIETFSECLNDRVSVFNDLESCLNKYTNAKDILDGIPEIHIEKYEVLINNTTDLYSGLQDKTNANYDIGSLLSLHKVRLSEIDEFAEQLKLLLKQMPQVCPVCNQTLRSVI